MESTKIDVIKAGLFFLSIFISGFWLRRSGKPYATLKLNVHKFIALGTLVYLGVSIYRMNQAIGLGMVEQTLSIIGGALFLSAVITGGLVSVEKQMPSWVQLLHKLSPYLTVLTTAAALYLMVS
jgi:hypothetical protein